MGSLIATSRAGAPLGGNYTRAYLHRMFCVPDLHHLLPECSSRVWGEINQSLATSTSNDSSLLFADNSSLLCATSYSVFQVLLQVKRTYSFSWPQILVCVWLTNRLIYLYELESFWKSFYDWCQCYFFLNKSTVYSLYPI